MKVLKPGKTIYGPGGKVKAGQPITANIRAALDCDEKHPGLCESLECDPPKEVKKNAESQGTSGKRSGPKSGG
jgi:hypothetical protein